MGAKTNIEWTDATWNPVTGCTKVSSGCDNCYAERFAERFRGVLGHPFENGFDIQLRDNRLQQPLNWKTPKKIFVNSMSDLFHKEVPEYYIDKVFDIMEQANWHIFQLLTKRSSLMRNYINERYKNSIVPEHIWCGVSVEDSKSSVRIRHLQESKVAIRFISMEPLIDSVGDCNLNGIAWVIVGGESGPHSREIKEEWILEIQDMCKKYGTAFFFKQWGGCKPKSNGRLLRGKEYNDMPSVSNMLIRSNKIAA